MSHSPFHDRRVSTLLNRVSEDLSQLRNDMGNLFSHTTRHTLPRGAREIAGSARDLADTARNSLAAGSSYATSHLRSLRGYQPTRCTTGWVGGAVLIGLLAAGVYALCQNSQREYNEYDGNDGNQA